MKKFTGIIIVFLLIFSLIGCDKYIRDNSPGAITEITLDQSLELAKKGKENIILYSITTCKDCIKLKEVLNNYLKDHSVEINEVILDNEGTTDEEIQRNRKKINAIFPEFTSIPSMYYLKDGKVIDEAIEITTEEELDTWVVKNKLDKK